MVLIAACGGGPVPVFWVDLRAAVPTEEIGSFDRIAEACEFWTIDCEDSDDDANALVVLLEDHGGPGSDGNFRCGETSHADPCNPMVFACDDGTVLEHEIGHAFGLEHRGDVDNVMHFDSDVAGDDTAAAQRRLVHHGADRLSRC